MPADPPSDAPDDPAAAAGAGSMLHAACAQTPKPRAKNQRDAACGLLDIVLTSGAMRYDSRLSLAAGCLRVGSVGRAKRLSLRSDYGGRAPFSIAALSAGKVQFEAFVFAPPT
jgi:hypothetical protein